MKRKNTKIKPLESVKNVEGNIAKKSDQKWKQVVLEKSLFLKLWSAEAKQIGQDGSFVC